MGCMSRFASNSRERELYRYYYPSELEPPPDDGKNTPRASSDAILTAFAQLGALRLNSKRGIITLSTLDSEFILAESGKALSLQQDDDEHDKLWLGVGLLKTSTGMGPAVTQLFSDPKNSPPYVAIGDLTKDERFNSKSVITGPCHVRSLACVPLRTPGNNVVIGAYVVVDDKSREGYSEADLQFLLDMGVTVMDYLEAGRIKKQQFRAERMVKAIGLFIEGKASLREWWLEVGHKFQPKGIKKRSHESDALKKEADAEFGVQDMVDYFSGNALHGLVDRYQRPSAPQSPSAYSTSPSQPERGDGRPPLPRGETLLSSDAASSSLAYQRYKDGNASVTTFDVSTDQTTPDPDRHPSSVAFDIPPPVDPVDMGKDLQEALLSSELRSVFSRSSNLIREAIGVEGVIYFDASVGSIGGSSDKINVEEDAPGAFQTCHVATSSEDEAGRRLSEIDGADLSRVESHSCPTERFCNVMGFSTRQRSSLYGHSPSEDQQQFPETALRKLLKRYPHGKVFNFEQDGTMSASESEPNGPVALAGNEASAHDLQKAQNQARRKKNSREAEAQSILRVLPGARSVFWFPLWDANRERWFSGSLVWSTCPTRTLCPVEDITYLAAFGNSTMAEVSRLSAQVLSKMKTDFISSISHELRSPLHGVLASVELIQETPMTEFQIDMINNIQASGKVLLDTINHVLDFSKVNRKVKERRRSSKRPRKKSDKKQNPDDGAEEKADICVLSEEVIESIYAGQSINKKAFDSTGHRRKISINPKEAPPTIIVDIHWRPNWTFEIDAGAWRRIVMNLFSNAMKYTKQGYVKISMEIEDDIAYQKRKPRSNLLLKIKDSGKGIGSEFLNHQLFKPFSQEDNLASGAGLGLSIVKAIVQELGGKIQFVSEPGSGTEALVQLPLTASSPEKLESLDIVEEVRGKATGLKFRLKGFDRYPDISEPPTGILSADAEAAMFLKSSMKNTFIEWFGMDYIPTSKLKEFQPDVIVVMEAGLGGKTLEEALHSDDHFGNDVAGNLIVVVITATYHSGPRMDSHGHFKIFYVQQPYGPHKIAKTLHSALCLPFAQVCTTETPTASPITPQALGEANLSSFLSSGPEIANPMSATKDFAIVTKGSDQTYLQLPIARPDLQSPTKGMDPPKVEIPPAETTLRVLLVEDNEINLKLLIATMRKLKLEYATAMNGLEALNTYKESGGEFDVIFMDISMPIMSGIESTQHIRRFEKDKALKPVALIALTGAANPSTRQEAFSSGVDLYMTKPVPMKTLRVMLEDLRRVGRASFVRDQ